MAVHGVTGVDRHVDHRGLELTGIGIDEAWLVRPDGHDLDPRPDQRPDHFAQRLHVPADVEHFRLQRLTPRERQQLGGQARRARDRVRNRIDVAQPARLRQIRPPQQIDGGADHRQQIVEVVRDAAGELTERLEPLAVLQRLLGLLPLGGLGIEMRVRRNASASRKNSSAVAGAPKIRCWLMVESQRARIADVSRPALI